jgi:hypothetical protein
MIHHERKDQERVKAARRRKGKFLETVPVQVKSKNDDSMRVEQDDAAKLWSSDTGVGLKTKDGLDDNANFWRRGHEDLDGP